MAEGLLLLLVEPETKNRDKYQKLDKEYEFEILFGVETDTYDVLGITKNSKIKTKNHKSKPLNKSDKANKSQAGRTRTVPQRSRAVLYHLNHTLQGEAFKGQLEIELKKLIGEQTQLFPPYSSARVGGKPLFWWARNNKLKEIEIPSKEIEIYRARMLDTKYIDTKILRKQIIKKVNLVKGDFRQNEIIRGWEEFFDHNNDQKFTVAKCEIHCSSGTYVRSIAHNIGKKLGTRAIALSIKRTKVGSYSIDDCIKLE